MDDELSRAIDRYVAEDMAARLVEANYRFLQEQYPFLKAVADAARVLVFHWASSDKDAPFSDEWGELMATLEELDILTAPDSETPSPTDGETPSPTPCSTSG